jgi:hypothetical protein
MKIAGWMLRIRSNFATLAFGFVISGRAISRAAVKIQSQRRWPITARLLEPVRQR